MTLPSLNDVQVSVYLMESGNPPEDHDELIELVASDETGFLSLFSQLQLQVSNSLYQRLAILYSSFYKLVILSK